MNLPIVETPQNFHPGDASLSGRVILVTGAGQGLGKVAATAFAAAGATVVLHGRTLSKLESLYDEIEATGAAQPAILPLDFTKTSQTEIDAFAQSIHAATGRLDGIFHAASAFVSTMPLALQDLPMWNAQAAVNLSVPASLTKACLPMLRRAPDASVIFLTESHAIEPKAYWGTFGVTKSALSALVAIWTDESEQDRVRFNLCLPAPVASPMRAKSHPGESQVSLLPAQALAPSFLYLMGPASNSVRGKMLHCQPGYVAKRCDIP